MIFQPQDRDYISESRQTTITTLSHTDHTVNVLSINSIGIFSLISWRHTIPITNKKKSRGGGSKNHTWAILPHRLQIQDGEKQEVATHKWGHPLWEKEAKRNSLPPLGSALILWWCIQHSDVIAKSHLVLPDPIKSEYDGGNTDVWLYGPERTTRWMSQKSQKTQFCSELGILWPLSEKRKRKPTISFMLVEFHTHFLFYKRMTDESVGIMKLEMKRNA